MEELSLLDYMAIWRANKVTIIVAVLAALVIAGVTLVLMPKTYEGTTTLVFPEQQNTGLSAQLARLAGIPLPSGVTGLSGRDVYTTVLKSRTISERVCRSLNLQAYGLDYDDLQDNLVLKMPKEGGLVLTFEVPTSWLKGYVASRELQKSTARLAADIANQYISELRAYDRSNTLFLGKKHRIFIEEQLARTKAELARAEARLQKFQETHPLLAPPDKSSAYVDQALSITTQQAEADVALEETSGQIARARSTWDKGAPDDVSPEAIIESPVISDLRVKLADLEVKRATLLEEFTENHPDVVGLSQEIEKIRSHIKSEVTQIVEGQASSISPAHQELLKQIVVLEITRDGLKARREALSQVMSKLESRMSTLPSIEMQYVRLLRDVKASEAVYTALLTEHAKARVTEGMDSDNFIVLDEAVPEDEPAKPSRKLTLLGSGLLGLILGMAIATATGVQGYKRATR